MQGEANKKYGGQAYKLSEEVFTARGFLSFDTASSHRMQG